MEETTKPPYNIIHIALDDSIPFVEAFKATVTNRYFLIALGLMIFYTAYQIIIGTDLTYYCQYVLGNVDFVMPLSAAERLHPGCCGTASVPDEYYQCFSWCCDLYHERNRNRTVLWRAVFSSK